MKNQNSTQEPEDEEDRQKTSLYKQDEELDELHTLMSARNETEDIFEHNISSNKKQNKKSCLRTTTLLVALSFLFLTIVVSKTLIFITPI